QPSHWDAARLDLLRLLLAIVAGGVCIFALLALGVDLRKAAGISALLAVGVNILSRSIIRDPQPVAATAGGKPGASPAHQIDSFREVVETVVFVVVLVLLLKSFAAEAFVIPTGSMAETLYGYQKIVKCPQC